MSAGPKVRCAIYTRKSCEDGLEKEFNSLEVQHDACLKYIQSQRGEGWEALPDRYDDGGFTGGNMERPALKRLFRHIEEGLIDVVLVYKIDRLSRSLFDFVKMVHLFGKRNVSFVSITQQFNTSSPIGNLMIHVLMSFAEYEREITGERIRDKIAASKAKGMWTGGVAPLGYDINDRRLVINEKEATLVRHIYSRYLALRSVTRLIAELDADGHRTKLHAHKNGRIRGSKKLATQALHLMLRNPIYIGKIKHKKMTYPGKHPFIIDTETWERVQAVFKTDFHRSAPMRAIENPFILKGIIFDHDGRAMTPSRTRKGRASPYYRYYVSTRAVKEGYGAALVKSINAENIEREAIVQMHHIIADPEMATQVYGILKAGRKGVMTLQKVKWSLARLHTAWKTFFPAEQNRLLRQIIMRVTVTPDCIDIIYQPNGIAAVCQEMAMLKNMKEGNSACA